MLVARLDNDGDVLLAGPAMRAVAAGAARLTLLCGPRGAQAARLLPGIDELVVWRAAWIDPEPTPVDPADVAALVDRLRAGRLDAAVVLTSYHQSPLPLALLLRLAGVGRISAISEDYPGSLLDVRHRIDEQPDIPEAERGLSLAAAAGFRLPPGDDGRLEVRRPLPDTTTLTGSAPYVVIHPGASVPARTWSPGRWAQTVRLLTDADRRVIVTGGPGETALTEQVAARTGRDLGGRTTLAELADVLDRAEAVVIGNTGPAHLAAAVGTPVVSLFAPTVPARRWAPYGVPVVLLGDQLAACRDSRARICPLPGHPCLESVRPHDVLAAVHSLARVPA